METCISWDPWKYNGAPLPSLRGSFSLFVVSNIWSSLNFQVPSLCQFGEVEAHTNIITPKISNINYFRNFVFEKKKET